jgi:hypothetical protein
MGFHPQEGHTHGDKPAKLLGDRCMSPSHNNQGDQGGMDVPRWKTTVEEGHEDHGITRI